MRSDPFPTLSNQPIHPPQVVQRSDLLSVIVPKALAKKKPRTKKDSDTTPSHPPPGPAVSAPATSVVAPLNKNLGKKGEQDDVKGKKVNPEAKSAPATSSSSSGTNVTPRKQPAAHESSSIKRKSVPPSTSDSSSKESEAKRVRVHLMSLKNIQNPESSPAASSSAPNPQKKKKRKVNKGIVIPAGKNIKR